MRNSFSLNDFERVPVVGILRGMLLAQIEPLVQAAVEGGLTTLEITLNSPGAVDQIRRAVSLSAGALNIGAGTVTTVALLDEALEAGAGFIVTPVVNDEEIRRCVDSKIPVFPGAFTPTEILRAWDLGATMVKVFPAEVLGPAYIKSVKAPLPQVRLMPTGGVDLESLSAYRAAGADAFGVGSPLFRSDRIAASDWAWVRAQCRAFVERSSLTTGLDKPRG